MSDKKKKKVPAKKTGTQDEDILKIDKTFDEAIKATMFAANKRVKKSK